MVKEYQRRRDYAVKAINEIPGLHCECPKGAFYMLETAISASSLSTSSDSTPPVGLLGVMMTMARVLGVIFALTSSNFGLMELRQAIADKLKRENNIEYTVV